MPQGINTNVSSLNAQRSLSRSDSAMSVALRRLSSGLRINSAADDAAGLAISERLTTQVRGLAQAARNANDGISFLQTAEGALATVAGNLQRVRELAVQAANGSNSATDRAALQLEAGKLIEEIDRISSTAEFNGSSIFGGATTSVVGDPNQVAVLAGLQGGWMENGESMVADAYGLSADGAALSVELTTFTDGVGGTAARVVSSVPAVPPGKGTNLKLQIDMADFNPPNLPNGGTAPFYSDRIIAHEMTHAVMARTMNYSELTQNHKWFLEGSAEFVHGADERVAGDLALLGGAGNEQSLVDALDGGFQGGSDDYSASYTAIRYLHAQIKAAGGNGIRDVMAYLSANQNATLDNAFANAVATLGGAVAGYTTAANFLTAFDAGGAAFMAGMNLANADTGAAGGADADGGSVKTAASVVSDIGSRSGPDVTTGFEESFEAIASSNAARTSRSLQVGANAGQTLDFSIGSINANALGLRAADISTGAQQAIMQVDRALDYVSSERANLGAQLNRLESVVSTLQSTGENLSASRSRIQDADYAAEVATLTRAQILQQAGVAMVAQANAVPNLVLSLLR